MYSRDDEETFKLVVKEGIAVCINSYRNIHTDLYLLVQHLSCMLETTRDVQELEEFNTILYNYYTSISAAYNLFKNASPLLKDITELQSIDFVDDEEDSDEDDEDDDE